MQRIRLLSLAGATLLTMLVTLSVENATAAPRPERPTAAVKRPSRAPAWLNQSQMVITSQGVMHRSAAARLGLPGTPLPTGGNGGGTQDPGVRR
jgi:hypothetical protein